MSFDDYPTSLDDVEGFDRAVSFTGPCGDTIEFFIKVKDGKVEKIAFRVSGCMSTLLCGEAACKLAHGLTVEEAKRITADMIASEVKGLPRESYHCAELAETALKMALELYGE